MTHFTHVRGAGKPLPQGPTIGPMDLISDPDELPESTEPLEIPHTALSPAALHGLVESFVLREGTDYGEREFTHAQKVAQVVAQLARGEARILYDPQSESITLVPGK
jgi:uncharacterized protein YheU (UPF0270 family)